MTTTACPHFISVETALDLNVNWFKNRLIIAYLRLFLVGFDYFGKYNIETKQFEKQNYTQKRLNTMGMGATSVRVGNRIWLVGGLKKSYSTVVMFEEGKI